MAEAGGVKEGDYVRINISPSELANEADIDVHMVKDLLNRLSEAGIVTFEEKAIKVKGVNKLRFFDFLAVKKESGKI
jgi:predicted transcriptional regulator